jgi:VIT1/CCC1 family predicted Fe2+/Mn2+ transporter
MLTVLQNPFVIKNIVYGIQDSLISTTGVLVGTKFAGFSNQYIVIIGIITILTEALSMGYGAFLSDESFLTMEGKSFTNKKLLYYALVMFLSYGITGAVVLSPYFTDSENSHIIGIILTLFILFVLVFNIQKDTTRAVFLTIIGAGILFVTIFVGKYLEKYKDPKQLKEPENKKKMNKIENI